LFCFTFILVLLQLCGPLKKVKIYLHAKLDDIPQSTAEIKLVPVSKTDGRHIVILFTISIMK